MKKTIKHCRHDGILRRFKNLWLVILLGSVGVVGFIFMSNKQEGSRSDTVTYSIHPSAVLKREVRNKVQDTLARCDPVVNIIPKDTIFQYFPDRDMYLYSAYLDLRQKNQKRLLILGFSPLNPGIFYCQLYFQDGRVVTILGTAHDTHVTRLKYQKDFHYKSHMYICDIFNKNMPSSVSLVASPCEENPSNRLVIHKIYSTMKKKAENRIGVCLRTMFGNLTSAYRYIEYMEYQKLMNSSHVILYGYKGLQYNVRKAIDYYKNDGFLKVQRWDLPVNSSGIKRNNEQIKDYGQHVMINDCTFRNSGEYEHLLHIDLDEYITPNRKELNTYQDIIKYMVNKRNTPMNQTASLQFLNVHFCLTPGDVKSQKPQLLLFDKFKRNRITAAPRRVKSLINPRIVVEMGVHQIVTSVQGFTGTRITVPPDVALMHHYRFWRPSLEGGPCNISDKTSLKFQKLIPNVNFICSKINIKPLKLK